MQPACGFVFPQAVFLPWWKILKMLEMQESAYT
jgi:hypothetical protein